MDDSTKDIIRTTKWERRRGRRRFTLRDTALLVLGVTLALIVLGGESAHRTAQQLDPGFERDVVVAATEPAAWIAGLLPFEDAADSATAWISPDEDLGEDSGFAVRATAPADGGGPEVPIVTSDAFDPKALGAPAEKLQLGKLLVTGDSMSMPLDTLLARRLSADGVKVVRDPHIGTGLSKSVLVDWSRLSRQQVRKEQPDGVVVFIGANEGYPLPDADGREVECCGPAWAAAYANRARLMMQTYRRNGGARVYWLTLPTPRDPERATIARSVNAAIRVAAEPFRAHVRVLEMTSIFTPGDRFRSAMDVEGRETIVRESDGIHLNETGSSIAADEVLKAVDADFTRGG